MTSMADIRQRLLCGLEMLLLTRESNEQVQSYPTLQIICDPPIGGLPFDRYSSDDAICAVLLHRDVVWINRMSGHQHTAVVGAIHTITRRGGDDDYITFIDKSGYHSVYLNQIVAVG